MSLVTVNGKKYFKSGDVKAYPATFRGHWGDNYTFDPESRAASEYNLLRSGGLLNGSGNYIIEFDQTNHIISCVIGGYYFELANIEAETIADLKDKFLFITLREIELVGSDIATASAPENTRKTKVLARCDGNSAVELDSTTAPDSTIYYFAGIGIDATVPAGAAASLKLFDAEGNIVYDSYLPKIYAGLGYKVDGSNKVVTSIVLGDKTNKANGDGSLAHGENVIASGNYSHAEGYGDASKQLIARGIQSHAEGLKTLAAGTTAHAEGEETEAYGISSHAEGYHTITGSSEDNTKGKYAHAEGESTTALGQGAHAEGKGTTAKSKYSHTSGIGTISKEDQDGQTVVGIYNTEADGQFIVGNGSSADNRKNSLVVNDNATTLTNELHINDGGAEGGTNYLNITRASSDLQSDKIILKGKDAEQIVIQGANSTTGDKSKIGLTLTGPAATFGKFTLEKNGANYNADLAAQTVNIKLNDLDIKQGDDSKIKYTKSGDTLALNGTTVNITGVTNITGTLKSTGRLDVENNGIHVTGDSDISGSVTLGGASRTVSITGATTIDGTVGITGLLTLGDNVTFTRAEDAQNKTVTIKYNDDNVIQLNDHMLSIGNNVAGSTTRLSAGETIALNDWEDNCLYLTAQDKIYLRTANKLFTFDNGTITADKLTADTIEGKLLVSLEEDSSNSVITARSGNKSAFKLNLVTNNDNSVQAVFSTEGTATDSIIFKQNRGDGTYNKFYALNEDGETVANKLKVLDSFAVYNGNKKRLAINSNDIYFRLFEASGANSGELYIEDDTCNLISTGEIKAKALYADDFYVNSDARLKENINQYKNNKSILDLPIYSFDYINGAKNQIGCLAQDLQQVCPELVTENENGYLAIQETKLAYLLLAEIKKLKKELEELKK